MTAPSTGLRSAVRAETARWARASPFVKPPTERRPLREQSAAKREWHRGLIGPGPARRGGDEQHELCRRVVDDLNGNEVGIVECLEHILREGGDRVDRAFDRVEARRNLVERPESALGCLRHFAGSPFAGGIPPLPCAQDRRERSPADPEPPALIAEQEAMPAEISRISRLRAARGTRRPCRRRR